MRIGIQFDVLRACGCLTTLGRFKEALAGIEKGWKINSNHDDPWQPRAKGYCLASDIYREDLG